jgi:hypothetical protein
MGDGSPPKSCRASSHSAHLRQCPLKPTKKAEDRAKETHRWSCKTDRPIPVKKPKQSCGHQRIQGKEAQSDAGAGVHPSPPAAANLYGKPQGAIMKNQPTLLATQRQVLTPAQPDPSSCLGQVVEVALASKHAEFGGNHLLDGTPAPLRNTGWSIEHKRQTVIMTPLKRLHASIRSSPL